MSLASEQPILVLPVYNGKHLFREALRTVKLCSGTFKHIFVSINGTSPSADEAAVVETLNGLALTIVKTQADLPPAVHFDWLTKHLAQKFGLTQSAMILCHDDLLNVSAFLGNADTNICSIALQKGEIILGDYHVFGESQLEERLLLPSGLASCFLAGLSSVYQTSREEWINNMTQIGSGFTNLSGTVASIENLKAVGAFLRTTRASRGCRLEYMLASYRGVKLVSRRQVPLVQIRQHSLQGGRIKSDAEFLSDEIRYFAWLIINSKSLLEFLGNLSGPQGLLAMYHIGKQLVVHGPRRSGPVAILMRAISPFVIMAHMITAQLSRLCCFCKNATARCALL